MDIGKIIYTRRTELGLTLEDVGNAVGVSKSTVKKWEDGFISNMKRDKISKLAKILEINPVVFITGECTTNIEFNANNVLDSSKIRMIPIFESVSAGFGTYADDQIVDYIPLFINSDYEADETICIKVKGDSMYPKIENGDLIQVHRQTSVDSGSIAVLLLDDEEGLVKKVAYGDNWIELISLNPDYQTKRFEGPDVLRLQVVGLVKKIIKDV